MKRALIIGSSGGIGSAAMGVLAERGYHPTGLSRRDDGFDLADAGAAHARLKEIEGPFDVVLVATGILAPAAARPEKSLGAIDAAAMAEVLAVNTIGPALVLSELPRLLPAKGRSVAAVLTARVGSIGDNALGGWYSYRASKAAANQLVHTAAIEIARKRKEAIVVALHPGTVDTRFTAAYPAHSKVPAETSARALVDVIEGLTPAQTGGFFDTSGKAIPW